MLIQLRRAVEVGEADKARKLLGELEKHLQPYYTNKNVKKELRRKCVPIMMRILEKKVFLVL